MHIEDFEALIKEEENVDYRGIYNRELDSDSVVDSDSIDQVWESMVSKNKIDKANKQIDLSKAPGGFITYKAGGEQELIAVDKSVANIYGCETVEEFREFVGNSFIGMVHPDDRQRIENEIWNQISSTEWKMDYIKYRIIRKDGSIGYISDFGHLEEGMESGEQYFQVFLLDVTDQM